VPGVWREVTRFAISRLRDSISGVHGSLRIDGYFHLCRTGDARVDRLQDQDGDLCSRIVRHRVGFVRNAGRARGNTM
jgi:hypothetical protein